MIVDLSHLSDTELLALEKSWVDNPPKENVKRRKDMLEVGYSAKFAYHVVRLLLEAEQILSTSDLHLDRDAEVYKSIRRGEWTLEKLNDWASEKERSLETLYANSKLPNYPDEEKIKALLIECLEMHYGNLSDAIIEIDKHGRLLRELEELVNKHR